VDGSFVSWTKVPHWIVVTYPKADAVSGPDGKMQQREDFKSTCCAVQNLLLSMWSEGIGTKWTDGPIQRTQGFADICGIDLEREKVAGVIWYGFARGGLNRAGRGEVKFRRKGVEEVLDILP
jgi:nitroreductase